MVLRAASSPEGPQVRLAYYIRRPAACSRPPVTSRTHVRREYGANGGQILYVTYSRSTGTRCACSLSNSIARDIRA
jgi:hypothetical protein